tara:strand:- start:40 stop:150 length:111 start_codon:yes stop_codon:yes gene_type:complete
VLEEMQLQTEVVVAEVLLEPFVLLKMNQVEMVVQVW